MTGHGARSRKQKFMSQYFTPPQEDRINEIVEQRLQNVSQGTKTTFAPVKQWCAQHDIAVSKMYKLRKDGKVTFYNFGRNVFVKVDEMEKLMQPS